MNKLSALTALEVMQVRKSKGLSGYPRYRLKGTDHYLVRRTRWTDNHTLKVWEWFKFNGHAYRFVATAEDYLEDPNYPIEILFNMDIIKGECI